MKLIADRTDTGFVIERDEAGWQMEIGRLGSAAWTETCDWGDCDDVSVGFRKDFDLDDPASSLRGWLSVCRRHYDDEPNEERRIILREVLA